MTFGGLNIIESEHALALPKGRPFTDDMVAFVEHMTRLGMIHRKPAAFQLSPTTMVVHPVLARQLRQHARMVQSDLERGLFYGHR